MRWIGRRGVWCTVQRQLPGVTVVRCGWRSGLGVTNHRARSRLATRGRFFPRRSTGRDRGSTASHQHPSFTECTSSGRMHSFNSGGTRRKSHFGIVCSRKPKSAPGRVIHHVVADHIARCVYDGSTCNGIIHPTSANSFDEAVLKNHPLKDAKQSIRLVRSSTLADGPKDYDGSRSRQVVVAGKLRSCSPIHDVIR